MTDLTARTQPAQPDCSRVPSLTDRITEILLGQPMRLAQSFEEWCEQSAALITQAAEEHYRPRIEKPEQLAELNSDSVVLDADGEAWQGYYDSVALPAVLLWSPGAGE